MLCVEGDIQVSASTVSDNGLHKPPSTRRLAGYTGWNLFGLCAPMVTALFAIPLLISHLGEARFGTLAIVWMLIGYFTIFDMGLGRAMTKFTAAKLARKEHSEIPGIFWTTMGLVFFFGVGGSLLAASLTPMLVHSWLTIPVELQPETVRAFLVAAAALPIVAATAGLIGILEAHQRFRLINIIRIPMGIYTFLGPLCVLPFSNSLFYICTALICGRVVECCIYFFFCMREIPGLSKKVLFQRDLIRPLFGFGGWMTVSNIAMPILVHIDRFLIGSIVNVSAVTFYATPAEIVVKLLIFPRAWVSVLFPSFAAQHATNAQGTSELYARGVKYLLIFAFPVVLVMTTFAGEGLQLWLGVRFAAQSAAVMRWLTAGIFIYSLSYVPFSLLQGIGRPDLSARLHLVEIPLYVCLSSLLIMQYGIEGAAMAWFLRSAVEALCMFVLARRFAPEATSDIVRAFILAAVALLMIGGTVLIPFFSLRLLAYGAAVVFFFVLSWSVLLSIQERTSFRQLLSSVFKPHIA